MTYAHWEQIATQIKELETVKTVNFYMMGEPFLNKSLCRMILDAKQRSLADKLIVTSNGSLVNPSIYKQLIDSKLDFLRISIYGSSEFTQQRNSQTRISLAKIRNNIIGLKEFRDKQHCISPHIYIKMIDSLDDDLNKEFIDYFSGVGDEIAIEPRMDWDSPKEKNLSQLNKDHLLTTNYFQYKKDVCPFPFYTLVIHSDLRVSVCCVDWSKNLEIGNLREESLLQIWQGHKLRRIQELHLLRKKEELDSCRNCMYLYTAPDNIDALPYEKFKKTFKSQ